MKNIYFNPDADAETSPASAPAPAAAKIKLRKTAVSPAREYAMRSGDVRPIGNDLAAMLLCRTGKAELTPKGLTLARTDIGRRRYGHPDHPLLNDFSEPIKKVVYAVNIHRPDVCHVLDMDGRYLGTLPEQGAVAVFDADAAAEQIAAQRRQIGRLAGQMQRLHRADTDAALDANERNIVEMSRIVQSLAAQDVPAADAPADAPTATRMARAERGYAEAARDRAAAAAEARAALILTCKDDTDSTPEYAENYDESEAVLNPFFA